MAAIGCDSTVTPRRASRGSHRYGPLSGIAVDNLYALSLLEATGICVVPASGFGQRAGRAGFRTTFLPAEDRLAEAVEQFASHHADFCAEWA